MSIEAIKQIMHDDVASALTPQFEQRLIKELTAIGQAASPSGVTGFFFKAIISSLLLDIDAEKLQFLEQCPDPRMVILKSWVTKDHFITDGDREDFLKGVGMRSGADPQLCNDALEAIEAMFDQLLQEYEAVDFYPLGVITPRRHSPKGWVIALADGRRFPQIPAYIYDRS